MFIQEQYFWYEIDKNQRLTNILCQELVTKKKRYSNHFKLNNTVYSEVEYPYIWE